MNNKQPDYQGQFTIEERKQLVAEMLRGLRKAKKLSQKEVSASIQVKPGTYSTYENGRTEPPAEILVRLAYLYNVPVDILVQKERTYRTAIDVQQILDDYQEQITQASQELREQGVNHPAITMLETTMNQLLGQMKKITEQEDVRKEIEKYTSGQ